MKISSSKYSNNLIIYCIIMLIAFFTLMRPGVNLSMSVRIVIMALCFIPVIFNIKTFPFVLVCFYVVSSSSFSPILPASTIYYVLIALVFYVFYRYKTKDVIVPLFILGYYYVLSLIHGESNNCISWIFIMVLLSDTIKKENDVNWLFYAFIFISAFLSILYLFNRGEFMVEYGDHTSDLERSGWINSNLFSAAIGAGAVLCVAYLTKVINLSRTLLVNVSCIITLVLSFVVLTLLASRGSFLAFIIPSILMLLLSKSKFWVKMVFVLVGLLFVSWMIKYNSFDLLMARVEEESFETGGGRTEIWRSKLPLFFNETNPLKVLFGLGQLECYKLGVAISTHNDFITAIISYGLIGLILFVYPIFVYPVKLAKKYNNKKIIILLLYIFIECCVLEPFFRGYIFVAMFYIFVTKYVSIMKNDLNDTNNVSINGVLVK